MAAFGGCAGGRLYNRGDRNWLDAIGRGAGPLQLEELRFRLWNHGCDAGRWQNLQRTVLSDHQGYDGRQHRASLVRAAFALGWLRRFGLLELLTLDRNTYAPLGQRRRQPGRSERGSHAPQIPARTPFG